MAKENISLDFILKKIHETRNYLLEGIKHNYIINKKHKKVCRASNYFEYFLILISAATSCVSISAFASLVDTPVGIATSTVGLKICAITARIKGYKPIIGKRKNMK